MVRVRNRVYAEIHGDTDASCAPAELLPHYQYDPSGVRLVWLIRSGGTLIGRAGLDLPMEQGAKVAYWLVEILRDHHGQGIGSAAYALIEQTAREHGRTILQSWAAHPDAPGPRLAAPTGFGDIPLDHAARFYQRHGYGLGQIERKSVFDLVAPAKHVDALLAKAKEAAVGYRVVQWTLPTPSEHIEGYAWAKSRMSTDVPAGDLEFDEERWDTARIALHDQRYLDGGQTVLVTAAVHGASGTVVAFNELVLPSDSTRPTSQEDTLVLKEHRGHRLGMLVKCAGIRTWRTIAPHSPKIITYNAEENRPMLDINEAIGFVPVSYEGAWKKALG